MQEPDDGDDDGRGYPKPQTSNPKPQASTEACGNCVSSLDTRSEQLKRAASQAGNGQNDDDVDQVQNKKNRIQIEHDESC